MLKSCQERGNACRKTDWRAKEQQQLQKKNKNKAILTQIIPSNVVLNFTHACSN